MAARSYGKILASIWDDPEWLNMSGDARTLYTRLVSGKEISGAGVLPLVERRWKSALWGEQERVTKALNELTNTGVDEHGVGWVLIDDDTAEVWIRSFIDVDGRVESKNPKMRTSVTNACEAVISNTIRSAIDRRYPTLNLPQSDEEISVIDHQKNDDKSPNDRRSIHHEPRTINHEPENSRPTQLRAVGEVGEPTAPKPSARPKPDPSIEEAFDDWYSRYPRKMKRADAFKAWKSLKVKEREAALAAVDAFRKSRENQDPQYTLYPASWLRSRSWEDVNADAPKVITDPDGARLDSRALL